MTSSAQEPLRPPAPVSQPTTPADEVAAVVLAVPGVASLHGGTYGEVATYLPGRRISGVRVGETGAEVHVVLVDGTPVLPTADRIRHSVEAIVGAPVHVSIEDVVDPVESTP